MPPVVKVVTANFPTSAYINEKKDWYLTVRNDGEKGVGGGAVWLVVGPSPIVVTVNTTDYNIPVGSALIMYTTEFEKGATLSMSGKVTFLAKGDYIVRLAGVHRENGYWYADDFREFAVKVEEVAPPPPAPPAPTLQEKIVKNLPLILAVGGVGVAVVAATRKKR